MTRPLAWLAVVAGLVALFALPSFTANEYLLALGVSFAAFSVLSGGLNLVYGYTGLLSFAQVGFFGLGAYTAALTVTELGWSLWWGALAGGALAAAVGLGIGYSSLRLSRHAFAIVTLSFALLCMIVSRDWVSLTRGAMGIPGLPVPSLELPGGIHWRLNKPSDFYYLLMGFAVLSHALIYLVVSSRLGRALRAVKLNEPLAQSQGINPLGYKLLAVTLSAFLAGVLGAFFVFYLTIADPSLFDFYYTETMLIMVILGGPGSFWGVLFATAVLSALPDLLRFTTDLRMVLYGLILIVAMLVFPGGIGGWFERRRIARWRNRPYGDPADRTGVAKNLTEAGQ
ncbi:LIV-I protein H [Variovorax sp. PBL-H6]|uniref:branched-chain amino acid ABC transporter permease n=1 Tax=Variovorax sp. PBL-H6 TaxID=434009 RepID=UPI0013172425|nr:branched-chain amino acid ABC transporter permease [Variovorax sp. PBL-H6]VTU21624.1 LIV-I protein H [Variovorax sp. PBL-H6]